MRWIGGKDQDQATAWAPLAMASAAGVVNEVITCDTKRPPKIA